MLHYGFPLSRAESDFAAEHHDLIFSYLSQAGLPADDFYDIAVFGYLQAVRRYLARPELCPPDTVVAGYAALKEEDIPAVAAALARAWRR